MFVVLLGAILASQWSFVALMGVIAIGGMWEFYRMADKAGYSPMKLLGVFTGIAVFCINLAVMLFFSTQSDSTGSTLIIAALGVLVLLVPLMCICELYRKSATPIANIASSIMGALYVALPMSLLLVIPMLLGNGEGNPWIVLFYIFIIWANDVFAYLFGITLGRHRLFERISPKKSWEGFFGGLGFNILFACLFCGLMPEWWGLGSNYIFWVGLAIVVTMFSTWGDLVESLMKRTLNLKDSGNMIPGHGGILDRIDSLLAVAPAVAIYMAVWQTVAEWLAL